MNAARISEPFCIFHYEGCTGKNIIFDRNQTIKTLLAYQGQRSVEERDVTHLIEKYWFHCHMSIKYFLREDIFKLLNALQVLFYAHTNLLLAVYQKTNWGGWDSLVKHNIPAGKQENLLAYFCKAEILDIMKSLFFVQRVVCRRCKRSLQNKGATISGKYGSCDQETYDAAGWRYGPDGVVI